MYDIALHIKAKDWFYILFVGVFFGMLLSALTYILLEYAWIDGAIFGALVGFSITILSLLFISYTNKNILPILKEIYWLPLSMLFSFLAGFFGTHLALFMARVFSVKVIPAFANQIEYISVIMGFLTYIFGALMYRFVKMRNQKDFIDNEYIKSRLCSLETQLNPHFLFNSLNSIAELIHHDKDKAERAVLKVSSFLRNSMREESFVDLKDEIKNAQDYVEVENIRFSDRIKLDVTGEIPPWILPKFSIQLLVENAIKHGYNPDNNSLDVQIEFDEKSKRVIVKNNGLSMSSKKFGIGLNNLNQRMKLLCNGSIEVEQMDRPTFYIHVGKCNENTYSR